MGQKDASTLLGKFRYNFVGWKLMRSIFQAFTATLYSYSVIFWGLLWVTTSFSCSDKLDRPEVLIGFSQCTTGDDWRQTMEAEMRRELSFHPGWELLIKDASSNSERQVEQIRELLAQEIDLLIVSPNEAAPLTPIVEEVYNSGVPVIVVDRNINSRQFTTYVGADNEEIGFLAGQYASRILGGNGKVVEIFGLRGSTPAIERSQGFRRAIASFPNLNIVAEVEGMWEKDSAYVRLPNVLVDLAEVDLIYAHNDVMALGGYESLPERIRKHIHFLGVDGLYTTDGGIDLVSDKVLTATMLYPTGGQEAIQLAADILNQESVPKINQLPSLVIDSTNVRVLSLQAKQLNDQQTDIEQQQKVLLEQRRTYQSQRLVLIVLTLSFIISVILGALALLSLRAKREANQLLQERNEEISRQRDQIAEVSAEKDVANRAKFEFFTNVSHEFRTPLTLILGPIEDLLELTQKQEELQAPLQIAHQNTLRMLRLINEVLDFRSLEKGQLQLKAAEYDLVEFIGNICSAFTSLAKRQQIEFCFQHSESHLPLFFDRNKLDKVIFNLLSNAFKFTRSGGKISLIIDQDRLAKKCVIRVEDSGPGINDDELDKIFDRFYQGSSQRQIHGSGLGLSLSKDIVELHQGELLVHSVLQVGTAFELVLPLGNDHLAPAQLIDTVENLQEQEELNYANYYIYDRDDDSTSPLRTEGKEEMEYCILIIEDNVELLNYTSKALEKHFKIYTATDGNAGMEMALAQVPDLIVSDVMMPGKNGVELLVALKNDMRTSHIPMILLTAKGDIEHQLEGIQAGAEAYISKPFHLSVLTEQIRSLIRNRKLMQQRYLSPSGVISRHNATNERDQAFISAFTNLVEDNIGNSQFKVQDICREIGLSRVQLHRKVTALLGYNISDYIQNARLKRAIQLLSSSKIPIAEVAYSVGFTSPSYFSTAFKAKYGVSPSNFRSSGETELKLPPRESKEG